MCTVPIIKISRTREIEVVVDLCSCVLCKRKCDLEGGSKSRLCWFAIMLFGGRGMIFVVKLRGNLCEYHLICKCITINLIEFPMHMGLKKRSTIVMNTTMMNTIKAWAS